MIRPLVRAMEGWSLRGWRLVFGIVLGGLTTTMHWPHVKLGAPVLLIPKDFALHALAFAGLSGLMMLARLLPNLPRAFCTKNILFCSAAVLVYGAITEVTQELLVPGRRMTPQDFAADLLGVVTAALVARFVFGHVPFE